MQLADEKVEILHAVNVCRMLHHVVVLVSASTLAAWPAAAAPSHAILPIAADEQLVNATSQLSATILELNGSFALYLEAEQPGPVGIELQGNSGQRFAWLILQPTPFTVEDARETEAQHHASFAEIAVNQSLNIGELQARIDSLALETERQLANLSLAVDQWGSLTRESADRARGAVLDWQPQETKAVLKESSDAPWLALSALIGAAAALALRAWRPRQRAPNQLEALQQRAEALQLRFMQMEADQAHARSYPKPKPRKRRRAQRQEAPLDQSAPSATPGAA